MGILDAVAGGLVGDASQAVANATGFDPTTARLAIAGLIPGGSIGVNIGSTQVNFNLAGGAPDWRVRISLAAGANYFYRSASVADRGIMSPLFGSTTQNGVIFPYTPSVQTTHTANYSQQKFTHSNYPGYFYENSEVGAITITGDFTVQNILEGQYLMAAITFFRTATKMWFGQGTQQGFPPPLVFLDGYGASYLPHVPCVITNFTHTMPQDCDYLEIPMTTGNNGGANGIGGAIASGISGVLGGGGVGAVQAALTGGVNSVLGSTMGPFGSGISGLLNQVTSGMFGGGPSTRMPTNSQISVTLQPVYSRKSQSTFNLNDFSAGRLLGSPVKGGFM
jgi:hypothetical protein